METEGGRQISLAETAHQLGFSGSVDRGRYKRGLNDGYILLERGSKLQSLKTILFKVGVEGWGSFWEHTLDNPAVSSYGELLSETEEEKTGREQRAALLLERIKKEHNRTLNAIKNSESEIGLSDKKDDYDKDGIIYFYDAGQDQTNVLAIQFGQAETIEVLIGRVRVRDGKIKPNINRLITIPTGKGIANFWPVDEIQAAINKAQGELKQRYAQQPTGQKHQIF